MPETIVTRIERNTEINIENFFTLWRDTKKDDASQARLLVQLLRPEFIKQVKLKDKDLPQKEVFKEKTINPELLNKILLHILIDSPQTWSDAFIKTARYAVKLLRKKKHGYSSLYPSSLLNNHRLKSVG